MAGALLCEVRRLLNPPRAGSVPARELLERFCRGGDEGGFGELVRRHRPPVLGACRRVLAQAQDAEDAFQATFLLLAQKAGSLRKQESVASWLFGVARRVAARARAAAACRRRHESQAVARDPVERRDDLSWREVR